MPNKPLKEYPLRHKFEGSFELSMEQAAANDTFLPLFMCDQNKTTPHAVDSVNVNPMSETADYDTDSGCTTFPNSVVNNVHLRLMVSMPIEDTTVTHALYIAGMVCTSIDDVDADNEDGTKTVGSVMKLKRETTNEDTVHPDWSGTDINALATLLPDDVPGLTGTQQIEAIDFDYDSYRDELFHGQLSGMLKKVTNGGLREYVIFRERPYMTDSWIKVSPRVKRQNKGTFCGILFHLPQSRNTRQFWDAAEVDATKEHLRISYQVEFNEYNDNFNQEAV